MNATHQKLLQVTCRLFAESGYQGTTTRRIADAAGVNEVTLFRHFGSKDALIRAALSTMGGRSGPLLDSDADDPAAELDRWGLQVFYHYYEHRNLIRRIMGEMVEHQELDAFVMEDCGREYNQLVAFFRSLERRGLTTPHLCAEAAAGMFLSSLLINALWRDVWPDVPNPEENIRHYVRLAARAIELRERAPAAVAGRRNGGSRRGAR